MKKKTLYFSLLSLISLLLLLTLHLNNTYSEFNSSNVRNNIYVLSSNTLGGRLAGSTENEIAAEIIKNKLKRQILFSKYLSFIICRKFCWKVISLYYIHHKVEINRFYVYNLKS